MKFRILFAAAVVLALASCSKKHPLAPIVSPPAGPVANSPAGAVQRIAWTMRSLDAAAYTAMLTDDYEFQFGLSDSAGGVFPDRCMDLTIEQGVIHNLFVGGGSQPPASAIDFTIDNTLVVQNDIRPGMNPRWHKSVRTHVDFRLTVEQDGQSSLTTVTGYAHFYVVRGDSAFFLPAHSALRDSTRWFVSRWEDETLLTGAPGVHAMPTQNATLGELKMAYANWGSPRR